MFKKIKIVLFFVFAFTSVCLGQEVVLKGRVLDSDSKIPLAGVSIYDSEKIKGAISDLSGNFKILVELNKTLTFSFLGYEKRFYSVTNDKAVVIYLQQHSEKLEEIVVVAKKNINDTDIRKATSSIANIKTSKIKERATSNIIESLQGQVAGLTVKSDGELGKPLKIRIRGTSTLPIKTKGVKNEDKEFLDNRANQPIFVLDGQIISSEAFETLNINDIEQIKVLKDAAANALYGVKASNGVIEITSKRGIDGKTQYSFSLQQGITFKGKPSRTMMDTEEKLNFEKLSKNPKTPGYRYSEEYIRIKNPKAKNINELIAKGTRKLDSIKKINTNWFNELSRISHYKSYNLSSRGGNKTNKFYVSGNFTEQGGKFNGNKIQRVTGRLNYEYNLTKKIYLMLNSGFGFSENDTPHSSDYSPANLMYVLNPYEQKQKGVLVSYPRRTFKNLVNQYSKNKIDGRFNFSANATAELAQNFNISSIVGIDYLVKQSIAIVPPTAYSEVSTAIPVRERGKANKRKTVNANITLNTRINYSKKFKKHSISMSANTDYYKNSTNFIGITGYGLPSKLLSGAGINNDIEGNRKPNTSSSKTTDAVFGFGFSALYTLNNKIDAYGSYKRDGSSLLPKDKRWNTFWAIGVGYTLSNEPFLKNINWLSRAKIKASYGVTASLSGITASLAVPTFTYGNKGYLGIREFYLKDLFNKDLKPEKNTSINLAIEINLFNRLNLTTEVYKRRTSNLLLTVPIAPSNGFERQLKNVGTMDNKGIEITINTTPINTDNFRWNTSANLSYNKNKVVELYEGKTLTLSNNPYPDYAEGQPVDLIYGLVSLGIDAADGKPIFMRKDGSILNAISTKPSFEDFYIVGHSTPPYNGGWYHNISYKGWQLSFDLYYSFGAKAIYTNQTRVYEATDSHKNLPKGQLKKTWFKPGDDAKIYKNLFLRGNEYYQTAGYANTNNVGSTNFIRLNNIMIRHKFSELYLKKIAGNFIKNWTMYTQLKNIATWSRFKGGDPESANIQGSSQPVFTIGANLTF